MVEVYVTLIINNRRTFESVPSGQKTAVAASLTAMGLGIDGKPLK